MIVKIKHRYFDFKKQYGASSIELGKRFGVSREAIRLWHKRDVLQGAIKMGHRPSRQTQNQTKYRRAYGASLFEITECLSCAVNTVRQLHINGQLAEILDGSRSLPKRFSALRVYGVPLKEIAARFKKTTSAIYNWHRRGILREALDTGQSPKSNCLYRGLYGMSTMEIAEHLRCSVARVHHYHRRGLLQGILNSQTLTPGKSLKKRNEVLTTSSLSGNL